MAEPRLVISNPDTDTLATVYPVPKSINPLTTRRVNTRVKTIVEAIEFFCGLMLPTSSLNVCVKLVKKLEDGEFNSIPIAYGNSVMMYEIEATKEVFLKGKLDYVVSQIAHECVHIKQFEKEEYSEELFGEPYESEPHYWFASSEVEARGLQDGLAEAFFHRNDVEWKRFFNTIYLED